MAYTTRRILESARTIVSEISKLEAMKKSAIETEDFLAAKRAKSQRKEKMSKLAELVESARGLEC